MVKSKAALIIGLNYSGGDAIKGLGPLDSAIHCAEDIAKWLEPEFDVELVTDADGNVTISHLIGRMRKLLGTKDERKYMNYEMLVIYFAGHGVIVNKSDQWVLNEAAELSNEAVSVARIQDEAQACGVGKVVILSDACRQKQDLPAALYDLVGSSIMVRNDGERERAESVDVLYAAYSGKQSWERKPMRGSRGFSIFSRALLRLAKTPRPELIREVNLFGRTVKCVPNRILGKNLQQEMDSVLRELGAKKSQRVQPAINSDDDVFMRSVPDAFFEPRVGAAPPSDKSTDESDQEPVVRIISEYYIDDDLDFEVEGDETPPESTVGPTLPKLTAVPGLGPATANVLAEVGVRSLADLAEMNAAQVQEADKRMRGIAKRARRSRWQYVSRDLLENAGQRLPVGRIAAANLRLDDGQDLPESNALEAEDVRRMMQGIAPISDRSSFETGCGLIWRGAEVIEVDVLPDRQGTPEPLDDDIGEPGSVIRMHGVSDVSACRVVFEDGRSAVVPLIQGFIGQGAIDSVGISSFSMSPIGAPVGEVAAGTVQDDMLAKLLEFRALLTMALSEQGTGTVEAGVLTDIIARVENLWSIDPTLTVLAAALMRRAGRGNALRDLLERAPHTNTFFDLALFSRFDHANATPQGVLTPCPLLTENWMLLASRAAKTANGFGSSITGLLPSLWTTFDAKATARITKTLKQGD